MPNALRTHALASSSRSGRYARGLVWRDQVIPLVKRDWGLLISGPVVMLLGSLLWVWKTHGTGRGIVLGASIATGPWLDVLFVVIWSGAASTSMGVVAESWTSQDLRKLKRRG